MVESFFSEVTRYWTLVDYDRIMALKGSAVRTRYIAAVLFTNVRDCLYPKSISEYINCSSPTLTE